jgi:hypothetical protein
MLRLYGVDSLPRSAKEQIAYSIETDIQDWINHVPDFFNPNRGNSDTNSYFYNVPWLFKRCAKLNTTKNNR